jgi:hypothetical protein
MDKKEAQKILEAQLRRYRSRSYAGLVALVEAKEVKTLQVIGATGAEYQLEVQFFWDAKPNGDIRVAASVDDGSLRAYFPLTDSFILSPQGAFIGE